MLRTVGFGIAANDIGVRVVARVRKPPNERLSEYLCVEFTRTWGMCALDVSSRLWETFERRMRERDVVLTMNEAIL